MNWDELAAEGNKLYAAGYFGEARARFLASLRERDNSEAHIGLGNCFAAQGRWLAAESEYKRAQALEPDSARPLLHLSSVYQELRDEAREREALRQARDCTDHSPERHLAGAMLALKQHDYTEAIYELSRALVLEPENAASLLLLAYVLIQEQRFDESLEALRRALRENPYCPYVHYLAGFAEWQRGHLEIAVLHFEQAVRLNRTFFLPYIALMRLELRRWRCLSAVLWFWRAVRHTDGDPNRICYFPQR